MTHTFWLVTHVTHQSIDPWPATHDYSRVMTPDYCSFQSGPLTASALKIKHHHCQKILRRNNWIKLTLWLKLCRKSLQCLKTKRNLKLLRRVLSRPTVLNVISLLSLSLLSSCLCVQSTSLNQFVSTMSLSMSTKFVLVAFENNGNGLDGFRVHLVALRCDDMTSVQSAEMSLIFSRGGWNYEYLPGNIWQQWILLNTLTPPT